MLAISLIVVGILLRFIPHSPNFTPVAAIALFGGAYLNKKESCLVPLVLMVASDLVLGLHNTVFFTWGSFALIALLGYAIKAKPTALRIGSMSLLSSLIFFAVTNFGVWMMGWYPRSASGLAECYMMALPFLRDFALSTLVYSAVFFGAYALVARSVRQTKLAKVLL